MSVLCDLSIASCVDDRDCLLDILDTEGRRHVSFDIGAASTPWITKNNALKWAL